MIDFLEAFDGYVTPLLILVVALIFRRPLRSILASSSDRIRSGSGFSWESPVGTISLGTNSMVTSTEQAQEDERERGQELEIFGDPDQLKVLFKVQAPDWKKSTKALVVPGGCLVQMTTERKGRDGSWTTAEALQFVPGVTLIDTPAGEGHMLGRL